MSYWIWLNEDNAVLAMEKVDVADPSKVKSIPEQKTAHVRRTTRMVV